MLTTLLFTSAATSNIFRFDIQQPMKPVLPPSEQDNPPLDTSTVRLSDILPSIRSVNAFAGFIRDVGAIARRTEDRTSNTTVLAPQNKIIAGLPNKPWEDDNDYNQIGTDAYEGVDGQQRADSNMQRFIERHIVLKSPWAEGEKVRTAAGQTIWWEVKDGKRTVCQASSKSEITLTIWQIQPSGIAVENVADSVSNGEIWVINGVLKA